MNQINSVHAQEAMDKHVKEIDQLLNLISTEMDKYKSLQWVNYGQVGEVAHVEAQLAEIWEFIAETE